MNQVTKSQDVWKPATEADKISALAALGSLPSRQTSGALDKAAYYLALDGVTRFGLSEAVKAILRGRLGHAFFPSPPELRMQCDKAMEHHVQMRERIARRQRIEAERIPPVPPLTEAQKERQRARMERFHKAMPDPEPKPEFDWNRVNERFDPKPETKSEAAE